MMNKKKDGKKTTTTKMKSIYKPCDKPEFNVEKIYKEFIPFESNSSKHKQTNNSPSILVIVLSFFFL